MTGADGTSSRGGLLILVPVGRDSHSSLRELSLLFLRLGSTAFGGPAAHIAMMRDEVVVRRQWMSEERFLDLLGATNLIPGPNSTEMAIHIGWARRRWSGLLVAGISFIIPAMLISGLLGWGYVRFGKLPEVSALLYGIKPVVLAVVVQAFWGLLPAAMRTTPLRLLGGAAVVASALGVNELVVLFGTGALALLVRSFRGRKGSALVGILPIALAGSAPSLPAAVSLSGLFWLFCRTGAVLFGSGYVLLAFLRGDLVQRLHWLSEAQLLDAIAVGQMTPGPVFTTATFIGYILSGPFGALAATLGIFLPAFVFVALSGPIIPRLRTSPAAGAFLDGVNVGSLALIAVVTVSLGRAAIVDGASALLAAIALLFLLRFRMNSAWLVAGGAAAGLILQLSRMAGTGAP